MSHIVGTLVCMDISAWRYLQNDNQGWVSIFLFAVWLQKKIQMDKDYIIFQENGLFGAKNQIGEVIIPPQYTEMYSFNCGLSMVRNHQHQYAYIDVNNKQVIPFGKYSWCDPQFTCGFSRVMEYHYFEEKNKWGIIDTLGNIVAPLKYDKIWSIKVVFQTVCLG